MGFVLKIIFPCVVMVGLVAWAHQRVDSTCEMALALGRNIPRAADWVLEAQGDPFLVVQLARGPIRASFRQFQAAAAIVRGDFGLLRLDNESKKQLSELAEARDQIGLSRAIAGFRPEFLLARCASASSASARENAFSSRVEVAAQDWVQAKIDAANDKRTFANDKEIYCQLDSLRTELETVVKAARERCAARKPGAVACAAELNDALVKEMTDLEQKRTFNLAKLQRKWPVVIMEQLKCASSSI